jgi:hypothetical protein
MLATSCLLLLLCAAWSVWRLLTTRHQPGARRKAGWALLFALSLDILSGIALLLPGSDYAGRWRIGRPTSIVRHQLKQWLR